MVKKYLLQQNAFRWKNFKSKKQIFTYALQKKYKELKVTFYRTLFL